MVLPLRSLHARMLALSAAATLAALVVAGWSISGILERFVIEGLDRRLDAEIALLASVVDTDGRVDVQRLRQRSAALEGGPDWRWRIVGPGGTIGSNDFPELRAGPPHRPFDRPDLELDPPRPPTADMPSPREGANGEGRPVHARQLTISSQKGPVTLTVAAPRAIIRSPILGALMPLVATLLALAVLLGTAALVQLRIGLRPVRRLRHQLAEIRRGTRERVDEDQPTELLPLAAELNALAADNAAALASARLSAANLAHALKTPLATLALDLRGQPAHAAQVARLDDTIRHHLARARVETVDTRASTLVGPAIDDIVVSIRRIYADLPLTISVDVQTGLTAAVDRKDLDEMIGNLLDNAARHATRDVGLTARGAGADARIMTIAVSDDGPGIPETERARVVEPGRRLDESGDGHGFGLAIVNELAALYGGGDELVSVTRRRAVGDSVATVQQKTGLNSTGAISLTAAVAAV